MIIRLTGIVLLTMAMSACKGQPINCDLDALQADLLEMRSKDQDLREQFMPVLAQYQKDGSGKLKLMFMAVKMEKQDAANQERLLAILARCGWPEELDREAHESVYLILQHSPDSIMRPHFPLVQAYAEKGLLAPDDPATMYDRLQMRAGLPQRYGTQTFADTLNRNLVWPVEKTDSLAARRAGVGLPSMAEYMSLAKDSTGIEMTWDQTLTVEEALRIRQ